MSEKLSVLQPAGLLLVRLVMGTALMTHGYPKLFASGPFLERFPQMGFPAWTVYLAGTVELFGGALGFLGSSRDEYPLLLAVTAFLLFAAGAGKLSLDYLIFRDKA